MTNIAFVSLSPDEKGGKIAPAFARYLAQHEIKTLFVDLADHGPMGLFEPLETPKNLAHVLPDKFADLSDVVVNTSVRRLRYARLGAPVEEVNTAVHRKEPDTPEAILPGHLLALDYEYAIISARAVDGPVWESVKIVSDFLLPISGETPASGDPGRGPTGGVFTHLDGPPAHTFPGLLSKLLDNATSRLAPPAVLQEETSGGSGRGSSEDTEG